MTPVIFRLLSSPYAIGVWGVIMCGLVAGIAWHIGYKTAMVEVLAILDGAHPAKLSPSVHHPDYYGDPWTEGMTAESKENRIDTV